MTEIEALADGLKRITTLFQWHRGTCPYAQRSARCALAV